MNDIITSFLTRNGEVQIPGVGRFYLESESAQLVFSDKKMNAPEQQINFEPVEIADNPRLIGFISDVEQIPEEAAQTQLHDWINKLSKRLENGEEVAMPFMGCLKKMQNGKVSFIRKDQDVYHLPEVIADRFVATTGIDNEGVAVEDEIVGEETIAEQGEGEIVTTLGHHTRKWWIAVLIIGLLSISIILFSIFSGGLATKLKAKDTPPTYISK